MPSSECQYNELIAAGSQPTRLGFLVRLVRRLIWPFIRPFHLFHLNKMNEIILRLDILDNQLKDHLFLRTELVALKNRFTGEEKLSQHFDATLDTLKNELHQLGYEIKILKAHNEKQIDYAARPMTARKEL